LLEACDQAGEEKLAAAILWLTAADALPLVRLGKEEAAVRGMLETLAVRTEEATLVTPSMPDGAADGQLVFKLEPPAAVTPPTPRTVNRQQLLTRVAATAGPQGRDGKPIPNANPQWSNAAGSWSYDFSDRMTAIIADELDALAKECAKHPVALSQQLHASQTALLKTLNDALTSQQRWVQEAVKATEARHQTGQLRLNALWWSEALYSQSLRCGYRELPPVLAAVVMAIDLLGQVTMPTPASVGHLLAEAVHRLPKAGFEKEFPLSELLDTLREVRGRLPKGWTGPLVVPPPEGRLSLRDLVVLALGDQEWDLAKNMRQAGLTGEIAMSLPVLARACFRQEQAIRLAGGIR
jgi:hypothetical protein